MTTAMRVRISAPSPSAMHGADVVFCLAAGLSKDRWGLSNATLANAREAARVARREGIPLIMMSGGIRAETGETESQLMARAVLPGLTPEVGLAAETESRNTRDQFVYLARAVRENGWQKVVVVCHPDHHKRVQKTAEGQLWGVESELFIVDAPAAYGNCHQQRWNSRWQARIWNAAGLLWYRLRGYAA